MGKVTRQKARKEWTCDKCGTIIKKGEEYFALHINYHPVRRRCIKCGFRGWELSSSYYVRTVGRLKDMISAKGDDHVLTDEELDTFQNILAQLGNEMEAGIDNMPDNLANSAVVQERQDQLDILDEILDEFPDAIDEITVQELLEYLEDL